MLCCGVLLASQSREYKMKHDANRHAMRTMHHSPNVARGRTGKISIREQGVFRSVVPFFI